MEKLATLTEIRSDWTIEDVCDANDMLNYMAAQQHEPPAAQPQMEPEVAAMIGRRR